MANYLHVPRSYIRWYCALALSVFAIFIGISLSTFDATDSTAFYFSTSAHQAHNACGSSGATLAALLFYLFGSAAFLWVPFFIGAAYLVIAKKSMRAQWERLVAGIGVIALSSVLLHVQGYDVYNLYPGGWIGLRITHLLMSTFDPFTTYLFMYCMLLVSLVLCLQFSFIRPVHYLVKLLHVLLSRRFLQPVFSYTYHAFRFVTLPIIRCAHSIYRLFSAKDVHNQDHSILEFERGIRQASLQDDAFWKTYNQQESILEPEQELFGGSTVDTSTQDMSEQFDLEQLLAEQQDEDDEPLQAEHTFEPEEIFQDTQPIFFETEQKSSGYALPELNIFVGNDEEKDDPEIMQQLQEDARTLEDKLKRFSVNGSVVSIKRGPVVTMFEYQPDVNSKISKIMALEDDLALALQALSIRILAPIPGKPYVGFEVSNRHRKGVFFADVIRSTSFTDFKGAVPLILGHDTIGNDIVVDLVRMPHLLVAGSTGSGKSVALNAMLVSMLCRMSPDDLRLVLIDPKRLEFSSYADIAHLLFPIITQPKKAAPVLKWVVQEMENRYERMATEGGRNIQDYNEIMTRQGGDKLPYIVVVIDELADLMMTAGRDIEDLIARITQMARAAGIHLIVATQRPSVDVITGLIKVNFPSRISFRVTSKIDSRTILDCSGADKLLGRGDMLFLDPQGAGLRRLHGAYVSDREIEHVVSHIRRQREPEYLDLDAQLNEAASDEDRDELYTQVLEYLEEIDEVSISLLQRKFKIGYNRSARIIDMLEAEGCIAPSGNGKTRMVIR